MQNVRSISKRLLRWFAEHARPLPWRRTRDPYAIWISEVMLQQTQVKTVIPFWNRWLDELPDIPALAAADESRVLKLWEGLGYYSRARNLHKAAQIVMKEHAGKFPRDFDAVLKLPGIGRYTAGAICSIAYNDPTPVLDGNVLRVLTRLYGFRANAKSRQTTERLWRLAGELVTAAKSLDSRSGCGDLNQALMELGATVCAPQNPACGDCPLRLTCRARLTNRAGHIPNLPRRPAATPRRFIAFVVRRGERYLLRQRPRGTVNHGLWEFPNVEVVNGEAGDLRRLARDTLRLPIRSAEKICTISHSITRFRISLEAYNCETATTTRRGVWLTPPQIDACALASAHRKILRRIYPKPQAS